VKDNLAAPYVKGGGKQTLGFGKKGAEKSKSAKPNPAPLKHGKQK
jgi:hypothetical protein